MKISALIAIVLLAAFALYSHASTLSSDVDACVNWGAKAWLYRNRALFEAETDIVPRYNGTSLTVNFTLWGKNSVSGSDWFVPLAVYCPADGENEIVWEGTPCC